MVAAVDRSADRPVSRLPRVWRVTPAELHARYRCDELAGPDTARWLRAADAYAPVATVFRWLCQLRVAPYSYDWVDNGCRRSPRHLVAGLDDLAVGQSVAMIFQLVDFRVDDHLTLRMHHPVARRLFGDLLISYVVRPAGAGRTRLVCVLRVPIGTGPRRVANAFLGWGDLVMMRRQLLNLARLAAGTPEPR